MLKEVNSIPKELKIKNKAEAIIIMEALEIKARQSKPKDLTDKFADLLQRVRDLYNPNGTTVEMIFYSSFDKKIQAIRDKKDDWI